MLLMKEKAVLTNETIAEWTEKAQKIYQESMPKKKPGYEVLLGVEETLLRFRDTYGTEKECSIKCYKRRNALHFDIAQQGSHINPIVHEDIDVSFDLLERLGLKPHYSFDANNSVNRVTVPVQLPPRKNALFLHLILAVLLAFLTGWIVSVLPQEVHESYIQPAFSEVFKKLSDIFAALATPLVFFAVINGIIGIGDVTSFGKIGVRLLKRMLFTYLVAMVVMVVIGLPFGLVKANAAASGGNASAKLITLVLDMIPSNLVEPFRIDNDLQVIVLAIFIGFVMLLMGKRIPRVREFCSELSDLVNNMMRVVCKTLPFFVYLGLSNIILGRQFEGISKVSQIVVISLVGAAIVISITVIRTLVTTKCSLKKLFTAQLPSLMINLTTSSQVSALPESIKCCREKFGIDSKLVDFGLPLGVVIYMPNGAIMLGALAWVLTVMGGGGPVDVTTLVKIAFVAMVIAIAAPPIPGSAFAVMPILFSACGTDLSMMPLAVIVGSTVGYFMPAVNGYCLQLELLMTAWKSDMADKGILKALHKTGQ